jgi:hypothetical protein
MARPYRKDSCVVVLVNREDWCAERTHLAEVQERWANIYGGKTMRAECMRLGAAQNRFLAALIMTPPFTLVFLLVEWLQRRLNRASG